ncbi:hypothetical protein BKA82DRAFT_831020 [Pisolithus tinctorius]|uniref:Secreted protein n=1 Tax=Pisolithus tinctorius Marx 270 TaxID=870435 RepID=A0A0C3KN83_PISTI|nr:hypothetical protein BKA82DRAFT_831020 [Pisolithus tinctorius]KIO11057.1 hypothetical protein M404DRAFT_831020 [Pisolithus tinctorius Marx 270]
MSWSSWSVFCSAICSVASCMTTEASRHVILMRLLRQCCGAEHSGRQRRNSHASGLAHRFQSTGSGDGGVHDAFLTSSIRRTHPRHRGFPELARALCFHVCRMG